MKNLLIIVCVFAFHLSYAIDSKKSSKSHFPKYNKSWKIALGYCECEGGFCSASQECDGSNCTCTCSIFTCTCSECKQLPKGKENLSGNVFENDNPVSVSEEQYNHMKSVSEVLESDRSPESQAAYQTLLKMAQYLEQRNFVLHRQTTATFVEQMSNLSLVTKNQLNILFASWGRSEKL